MVEGDCYANMKGEYLRVPNCVVLGCFNVLYCQSSADTEEVINILATIMTNATEYQVGYKCCYKELPGSDHRRRN